MDCGLVLICVSVCSRIRAGTLFAGITMASDEQQTRHLMEEWRRRASAGDVEGLLALTADHAVFLTPGHAPMTKNDFAARFGRMAAKVRIDPVHQVKDLGISGDLAYAWSHVTVVFTAKTGGVRSEQVTCWRSSAGTPPASGRSRAPRS